jgi:hypothetical protein
MDPILPLYKCKRGPPWDWAKKAFRPITASTRAVTAREGEPPEVSPSGAGVNAHPVGAQFVQQVLGALVIEGESCGGQSPGP